MYTDDVGFVSNLVALNLIKFLVGTYNKMYTLTSHISHTRAP